MSKYKEELLRISSIENKMMGGDWDEIEEAREIARLALEGDCASLRELSAYKKSFAELQEKYQTVNEAYDCAVKHAVAGQKVISDLVQTIEAMSLEASAYSRSGARFTVSGPITDFPWDFVRGQAAGALRMEADTDESGRLTVWIWGDKELDEACKND